MTGQPKIKRIGLIGLSVRRNIESRAVLTTLLMSAHDGKTRTEASGCLIPVRACFGATGWRWAHHLSRTLSPTRCIDSEPHDSGKLLGIQPALIGIRRKQGLGETGFIAG